MLSMPIVMLDDRNAMSVFVACSSIPNGEDCPVTAHCRGQSQDRVLWTHETCPILLTMSWKVCL